MCQPFGSIGMTLLTRIIHEGLFCNRRYENQNSLRYSFFAPGIIQRALDLASAVATHLTAGGLAARSVNILLGTGALLPGDCPRSESGTGTAADDGASPLTSARPSRPPPSPSPILWGRDGWGADEPS